MNDPTSTMHDQARRPSRPRGVKILSILHLLAGLGILVVTAFVEPSDPAELESGLQLFGLNLQFVILGWIGLAALLVVSSIGLWLAKPWGWWTAGYLYLHRVLVSLQGIFVVLGRSDPSGSEEVGAGYFILGFLIRIVVSVYVLAYLCHPDIRTYSGMAHVGARRAIFALLVVWLIATMFTELARRSLVSGAS